MRRIMPVAISIGVLGGCSAPDVEKAAGSFHDGYADSMKTLSNRTTALLSAQRTKDTYPLYVRENAAKSDGDLKKGFSSYVCQAVPAGLEPLNQGLSKLHDASMVVDPANITPDKSLPDKIKGIHSASSDFPPLTSAHVQGRPADERQPDQQHCVAVVAAYLALDVKSLPDMGEKPQEEVFVSAIPAAIMVVEAVWKATDTTLGLLEEQARANKLKRYIRDERTQENVRLAFGNVYATNQAINTFCFDPARAILCTPSVSKAPPDKPQDKDKAGAGPVQDSRPACFAELDKKLFSPPQKKTMLDSITLWERWSNLQLAWYSFYALHHEGDSRNGVRDRQALDQAVSDYLAVPATTDIAGSMVRAWAQLTYMSNGCITDAQAFGELKVFAENANTVFNSAKSVSDAKDKFATAIAPPKASK